MVSFRTALLAGVLVSGLTAALAAEGPSASAVDSNPFRSIKVPSVAARSSESRVPPADVKAAVEAHRGGQAAAIDSRPVVATGAIQLGPRAGEGVEPAQMVQVFDEAGVTAAAPDYADWGWQLMPQGLIYRPYLAGAKESRIRGVWNDETNDGDIIDVTLGGQVGLLRYGTRGDQRPEGWQLGLEGASLLRLNSEQQNDVSATDYRIGVPLTWGTADVQAKFAFYHLSSHVGDEFLIKNPGFDRLNYSRDVLVFGYSVYPLPRWRYYAEIGYGVRVDVCEPWEVQFGIDWAPTGATGGWGEPFAAVNGHLREEVDFGGNFVAQAGWAWRRAPASGMLRTGVEYYNGKNDQFSFFDDSEQKVGFGIWYDY